MASTACGVATTTAGDRAAKSHPVSRGQEPSSSGSAFRASSCTHQGDSDLQICTWTCGGGQKQDQRDDDESSSNVCGGGGAGGEAPWPSSACLCALLQVMLVFLEFSSICVWSCAPQPLNPCPGPAAAHLSLRVSSCHPGPPKPVFPGSISSSPAPCPSWSLVPIQACLFPASGTHLAPPRCRKGIPCLLLHSDLISLSQQPPSGVAALILFV